MRAEEAMSIDKNKNMNSSREFVATAFIVNDGKILLMLHKKLGLWLPPGGHIDKGELPCDAVIREVEEETGLKVEIVGGANKVYDAGTEAAKEVRMLATPSHVQLEDIEQGHQHIDLVYIARVIGGEENLNKSEGNMLRWFSSEELDSEEITDNIRHYGKTAIDRLMEVN